MPMEGIWQPEIIQIDDLYRLRKYDGIYDFALEWYQDTEMVYMVDGIRKPYDQERLRRMYEYLNAHGELYFIETLAANEWKPVGDVTFWQEDLPIVIGVPEHRGKGLGRKTILSLMERAKSLGWKEMNVCGIYHWNAASRKCFELIGFKVCGETQNGHSYRIEL